MEVIIRRASRDLSGAAKSFGVPLYRFLEGVATTPGSTSGRLHPTAEGVYMIVKNILSHGGAFLARYPGNAVEKRGSNNLTDVLPGDFQSVNAGCFQSHITA